MGRGYLAIVPAIVPAIATTAVIAVIAHGTRVTRFSLCVAFGHLFIRASRPRRLLAAMPPRPRHGFLAAMPAPGPRSFCSPRHRRTPSCHPICGSSHPTVLRRSMVNMNSMPHRVTSYCHPCVPLHPCTVFDAITSPAAVTANAASAFGYDSSAPRRCRPMHPRQVSPRPPPASGPRSPVILRSSSIRSAHCTVLPVYVSARRIYASLNSPLPTLHSIMSHRRTVTPAADAQLTYASFSAPRRLHSSSGSVRHPSTASRAA
jgi:hypothetical protein